MRLDFALAFGEGYHGAISGQLKQLLGGKPLQYSVTCQNKAETAGGQDWGPPALPAAVYLARKGHPKD
jgi:hypothetical protein